MKADIHISKKLAGYLIANGSNKGTNFDIKVQGDKIDNNVFLIDIDLQNL